MSTLTTRQQQRDYAYNIARAALFAACGIDTDRQARLLKRAVDKLEHKLEATKQEIISHQGDYQIVEVVDNPTQLRAAEAVIDLLGARPSKQSGDSQSDVIVNIVFPSACQPSVSIEGNQQVVESFPLLTEKRESGNGDGAV